MKALIFDGISDYPYLSHIEDYGTEQTTKVKLIASALNHRDLWILKGMYADLTPGSIMGADGVGVANGKEVILYPGIDWGDDERVLGPDFRALGMPDHGTFADRLFSRSEYVFEKPQHLSYAQAAALPLAGLTAYRALFTKGNVRYDHNVLITGIGGGVALMALSMAVALGCNVFVTSGDQHKIDQAISLGAKGGVNYKEDRWHKSLGKLVDGIDLVIDGAAGSDFNNYLSLCNPGANIVVYGGTAGKINNVSPQLLFWKQISIKGSTMGSLRDFTDMVSFVNEYKVVPVVDSEYVFDDYKSAFDRLSSGEQFGKVVLIHN